MRYLNKIALGLAASAAVAGFAAPALAWHGDAWSYRKPISFDAAAAHIGEAQKNVPVLIRLDSSNFRFEDAKPDGSDLRFVAADDRTELSYRIESYDAKVGLAMIWVNLPDLPTDSVSKIYVYYGAKTPAASTAPARVFDANYRAVFHFAGTLDDAAQAAGAPQGDIAYAPGAIGQAARFTGTPLHVAASQATAVDPAAGFTFEGWVKPDTAGDATLYKANGLIIGLQAGVPYVEVAGKRAAAATAIKDWSHIAVSANAAGAQLYVDGQPVANLTQGLPVLSGEATLGDGFTGAMDEVRLSGVARSASYIQAAYASQARGEKLESFGADEQPSGNGFGYFGVIFKNVTTDAKVVIAILAVMALISWIVMVIKGGYVGRVRRADRAFDTLFGRNRGQVLTADWQRGLGAGEAALLAQSPCNRIYLAGLDELTQAVADAKGQGLSPEALNAVRAALDAQQVIESQRLNRWMVLLTIAISGGPFIGLLGTVLGVMITFAAIALAGDVNVNAIAPGVAAALLATVTGLVVAIPALFGYNYIASRNSEANAGMQVFVDKLITRFAYLHRHGN